MNDLRNTSMHSNKSETNKTKVLSSSRRFKNEFDNKLLLPENYSAKKISLREFEKQFKNKKINDFNTSKVKGQSQKKFKGSAQLFKVKKNTINEYLESFEKDNNTFYMNYQTQYSNQMFPSMIPNKNIKIRKKSSQHKINHKRKQSENTNIKYMNHETNRKQKKKHLSIDTGKSYANLPISLQW